MLLWISRTAPPPGRSSPAPTSASSYSNIHAPTPQTLPRHPNFGFRRIAKECTTARRAPEPIRTRLLSVGRRRSERRARPVHTRKRGERGRQDGDDQVPHALPGLRERHAPRPRLRHREEGARAALPRPSALPFLGPRRRRSGPAGSRLPCGSGGRSSAQGAVAGRSLGGGARERLGARRGCRRTTAPGRRGMGLRAARRDAGDGRGALSRPPPRRCPPSSLLRPAADAPRRALAAFSPAVTDRAPAAHAVGWWGRERQVLDSNPLLEAFGNAKAPPPPTPARDRAPPRPPAPVSPTGAGGRGGRASGRCGERREPGAEGVAVFVCA